MSPAAGQPTGRVVAHLGRPETPEETAARQAESSRLYRARKTFSNLVLALGATLIAVLFIVFFVPRDDHPIVNEVDVPAAAEQSAAAIGKPVADPAMPEGWTANAAELRRSADGIAEWYVGYVISDAAGAAAEYAGLSQGFDANPTWVLDKTNRRPATGQIELAGRTWDEYDYTALPESDTGNAAYALATELDGSTLVVYGSRTPDSVRQLAEAAVASLGS